MSLAMNRTFKNEEETALFARTVAKWIVKQGLQDCKLYLKGNLGAGKTTFSRYFIQAFGVKGAIKSPTYTLIEPYELEDRMILHADLYRLASPIELFDLGLLEEGGVWLIEWPEKGEGVLPAADLLLKLHRESEVLSMQIQSNSAVGDQLLKCVDGDC